MNVEHAPHIPLIVFPRGDLGCLVIFHNFPLKLPGEVSHTHLQAVQDKTRPYNSITGIALVSSVCHGVLA